MYYNIHNQSLISNYPNSIILSNGTVIVGNNFDSDILADAGYYTVRNDNNNCPDNTIEDLSARIINLDKPYVDIIRTWIPKPVTVPKSISARQIRLWLINNQISLNDINNAINNIPDQLLREQATIEWEYAPYIERNHPMLISIGHTLGLTPEQIDNAFIEAVQI